VELVHREPFDAVRCRDYRYAHAGNGWCAAFG
jgi:hypothetical protein